jgi:hypothetical protein
MRRRRKGKQRRIEAKMEDKYFGRVERVVRREGKPCFEVATVAEDAENKKSKSY